MLQAYSVVFHGKSVTLDEWNRFIKGLRTQSIKYEVRLDEVKHVKTIMFWTDMEYIHNDDKKKRVPWAEMQDILESKYK